MRLFTTVDVIGQGLPLLMPNGVKIVQRLQRWVEDLEDNEWGISVPRHLSWPNQIYIRFPDIGITIKTECLSSVMKKPTKRFLRSGR